MRKKKGREASFENLKLAIFPIFLLLFFCTKKKKKKNLFLICEKCEAEETLAIETVN